MPGQPCPFPWSYAMIYPDGQVRACCYNGRDLGNLNERAFADIWNGPEYRDLRTRLLAGDEEGAGCANCPMYARSGWTTEDATRYRLGPRDGTPAQVANTALALHELEQGKTVLSARPASLALELSQACNFRCTFCFQEDKELGIRSERLRSVVGEAMGSVRELIMTGGDPFAYRDNLEILRGLSDEQARTIAFEFYTNGALLDRHWALLERLDKMTMVISLHSLVNETYQRIMGTKDPVSRVIANIDRFVVLQQSRPGWQLSLTNIVMKSTLGEISALARFAVERGAQVTFAHMHGNYDENIYLLPNPAAGHPGLRREITAAIRLLTEAGPNYRTAVNNLTFIESQLFLPFRTRLQRRARTLARKRRGLRTALGF